MLSNHLPVEIWTEIFSNLDVEKNRSTLASLCLVCKQFNAIGQPLVFSTISGTELRSEILVNALCGQKTALFGSWVKSAELIVEVKLEALCDSPIWQDEEIEAACQKMEEQFDRHLTLLSSFVNIKHLKLHFRFERASPKKTRSYNPPVAAPFSFAAATLFGLPCMLALRSLCLSGDAGDYFNLDDLPSLLSRLSQLQVLTIDEDFEPRCITSLFTHLATTASTCNLASLTWQPSFEYFACEDLLSAIARLPSLKAFTLDCRGMGLDEAWDAYKNLISGTPVSSVTSFRLLRLIIGDMPDLSAIAYTFPALKRLHLGIVYSSYYTYTATTMATPAKFPWLRHLSVHVPVYLWGPYTQGHAGNSVISQALRDLSELVDTTRFPLLQDYSVLLDLEEAIGQNAIDNFVGAVREGAISLPAHVQGEIVISRLVGARARTTRGSVIREARRSVIREATLGIGRA